jgi:signal recognition particle receptor subunit beta
MVFFNYATMQMAAKIVYYGPGLCGKTTNLQHIYQKTSSKSRGEMVSLETETDRTLFFDLLPLDVGNIAGFKTRFQLYTVPGQVFYNSTRKLVLRGVDGIVFVADSQVPMLEANLESFSNLQANLSELGLNIDEIPLVFQFNKRDLKNILPVEELNSSLNPRDLPYFEASALQGVGVFETLKGISKATLIMLRRRALGEDKMKIPEIATKPMPEKPKIQTPPPPPPNVFMGASPISTSQPEFENKPEAEGATSPAAEPTLAASTEQNPARAETIEAPTAVDIASEKVEFSQVKTVPASAKPAIKKIAVEAKNVASKLDALRDLYTAKPKEKKQKSDARDQLAALLGEAVKEEKSNEVTKKLKIRLEPGEIEILNNLSVDFHLFGGNIQKRFSNALNVPLEGKSNPKKLLLKIEIEILKKD